MRLVPEAIMDATLAEFAEKGFAAASIREIAARVDFPHTTITHHYKTKDLLWQAVAENLFSTIRKLWESAKIVSKSGEVFDRLIGFEPFLPNSFWKYRDRADGAVAEIAACHHREGWSCLGAL